MYTSCLSYIRVVEFEVINLNFAHFCQLQNSKWRKDGLLPNNLKLQSIKTDSKAISSTIRLIIAVYHSTATDYVDMLFFKRLQLIKMFQLRQFSNNLTPEQLLNDENRQRTIEKFRQLRLVKQLSLKPTRQAAVLIPICIVHQQVSLLYTLRAANLSSHGGQVSFPGGMFEAEHDKDLIETALRETEEELGIKSTDIDVWGSGNSLISLNAINVVPVIGRIRSDYFSLEQLRINRDEVDEVFTVTIRDLCDEKLKAYNQVKGGFTMPVFTGGKHQIWGLTAWITDSFLTAFIPNNAYNTRSKFTSKL